MLLWAKVTFDYKTVLLLTLELEVEFFIELRFLFSGVTTIAGGKWSRGGGHVDGPSEEAKFSDDFDVVYVGSSCSLLVIDRGNQAIREIQLRFDDCAYQYESGFPLGKLNQSRFQSLSLEIFSSTNKD